MKQLFYFIVRAIYQHGNIIEATLYKTGTSCTATFEVNGEIFNLMLIKEEKKDGNSND